MSFWEDWSDGKKWGMGILSALIVTLIISTAGILFSLFTDSPEELTNTGSISDSIPASDENAISGSSTNSLPETPTGTSSSNTSILMEITHSRSTSNNRIFQCQGIVNGRRIDLDSVNHSCSDPDVDLPDNMCSNGNINLWCNNQFSEDIRFEVLFQRPPENSNVFQCQGILQGQRFDLESVSHHCTDPYVGLETLTCTNANIIEWCTEKFGNTINMFTTRVL